MPESQFLLPGEICWHREPCQVTTLLGSCVAVALIDKTRHWAGLNHFMVASPMTGMSPGKVGETAMDGLVRLATMAGSTPENLVAEIYGGGAVIGHLGSNSANDIGSRNVELAKKKLQAAGIPIRHSDVAGSEPRRICLDTSKGTVVCQRVPRQSDSAAPSSPNLAKPITKRHTVLVVDDSPTVRNLLTPAINSAPDFVVCGEAEDPFQARERILELNPEILCLDLIMPNLDGLSFLRRLMAYRPIPTVVVSTIAKTGSAMFDKVMSAGAIAAIDKEELGLYQGSSGCERILLPALRQAARKISAMNQAAE